MNRSKKAALNVISQFVLQGVVAICGFIVPRLVLEGFGSDVNGLVNSISQFLGIMSLLEEGFGSVAKIAFYKPLACGDNKAISGVYNATESFFRKIALIFALYCVLLSIGFPFITDSGFDFLFTSTLVLIMGITAFMQYYFGMSYSLALNADQLSFISAFLQTATVLLNAVVTVIMLNLGAGIHAVKLVSASVFILKPIAINIYGKHRYKINRKIPKDNESLSQKWDNLAHGIATYVHTKTAYFYTTLFINFSEVSVYSVYSLVATSLTSVITGLSTGFVSGLGNMYAKNETENFKKVFSLFEFVNTAVSLILFTLAAILILPFVTVYTANVTDGVNYIRPVFGFTLIAAELAYCLRLPYYYMIINAGHFKQTKVGAYVEAALNVVVSGLLCSFLGITGLAIGMLVAMTFRTIQLMIYCSKNITKLNIWLAVKRIAINIVGAALSVVICSFIKFTPSGFVEWFIIAGLFGIITLTIIGLINLCFYKDDFKLLFAKLKNVVKK